MKKILELAEKVCTNYTSASIGLDIRKLRKLITERRQLEQTPITEDWLVEHGFVVSDEIHSKRDKVYVKDGITVVLDVDCANGIVGNADCIEINRNSNSFHKDTYVIRSRITLATLYDALELFDIKID